MTPHEVRARCAELGTPVVQSTLANYKSAGLIHPPVVQSLGRKIGKVSTYRDDAPFACDVEPIAAPVRANPPTSTPLQRGRAGFPPPNATRAEIDAWVAQTNRSLP